LIGLDKELKLIVIDFKSFELFRSQGIHVAIMKEREEEIQEIHQVRILFL